LGRTKVTTSSEPDGHRDGRPACGAIVTAPAVPATPDRATAWAGRCHADARRADHPGRREPGTGGDAARRAASPHRTVRRATAARCCGGRSRSRDLAFGQSRRRGAASVRQSVARCRSHRIHTRGRRASAVRQDRSDKPENREEDPNDPEDEIAFAERQRTYGEQADDVDGE
jgi:hypothetical protein